MGRTIIEKIFSRHSEKPVKVGDTAFIDIDVKTARDFGGANVVKNFEEHYGGSDIADAGSTFFTFDCVVPAKTIPYADNQQKCREFAKKHNIRVFDVKEGIGSHIGIDKGLAYPGSTFVGTDSHLNIMGSVGSFGQGMGDIDISFIFKTGKTWFEVPPTMKVVIKGRFEFPATPKDLTLKIIKRLTQRGALGRAIEFRGEAIDGLDLDGRVTLASMVTEMGGIIGFIAPDERIFEHFRRVTGRSYRFEDADPDADYIETVEIDISSLRPQLAMPGKPDNVVDIDDIKGTSIDSVFIGSCTNGRYSDIKTVYDIVKGKKIKSSVVANIVPSTREIYSRLLKEGILEGLFDAGFNISNPGCGGCASGQIGMTGKGEVSISTSNRNFRGKQGNGETYLASPLTAALAALNGQLTTY